jgi:hypothetical protein
VVALGPFSFVHSVNSIPVASTLFYKDEALDLLAEQANVAQFVSFDQDLRLRYCRIRDYSPNHKFKSLEATIDALIAAAPEHKVNIRSFQPEDPKGGEFVGLLSSSREVIRHLHRLSQDFFTIVNESIDVEDGGVSGVVQGGLCEFAPGTTPRCVEQEEVAASLPQPLAMSLLETVYGFVPSLPYPANLRVEFSLHPFPRGLRHSNTIIWELQDVGTSNLRNQIHWPNAFSKMLGDKVFGLLLANGLGFPVPRTQVLARRIPPFTFGEPSSSPYKWIRTAPQIKTPGHFSTIRGWTDPFLLMRTEDPDGTKLSSVLVQDEATATYSGALITAADSVPIIEGVKGFGDRLMLGEHSPSRLPRRIKQQLSEIHERLNRILGPIRVEWASDGHKTWILQLQQEAASSIGNVIYPGQPETFWDFDVKDGLEKLRVLAAKAQLQNTGIRLIGDVGMTSHLADVLRDSRVPSVKFPRAKPRQSDRKSQHGISGWILAFFSAYFMRNLHKFIKKTRFNPE